MRMLLAIDESESSELAAQLVMSKRPRRKPRYWC